MSIIINAGNINHGGALQVAVSFISQVLIADSNDVVVVVVSEEIFRQIRPANPGIELVVCRAQGTKFASHLKLCFLLDKLVRRHDASTVFSVFGPVLFRKSGVRHVVGFALPWLIYPTERVMRELSFFHRVKIRLTVVYQKLVLRHFSSEFVCETEDVKHKVNLLFGKKSHVVSNTCSEAFVDYFDSERNKQSDFLANEKVRVLVLAYPHPHKNIKLLFDKIAQIHTRYEFTVTLPQTHPLTRQDECRIKNIGLVDPDECPRLYESHDLILTMSLLECFSANVPEAFCAGRLLIAPNLPFFETLGGNAIEYFDPEDPDALPSKLNAILAKDFGYISDKILRGRERLSVFESSQTRATKYLEICRN